MHFDKPTKLLKSHFCSYYVASWCKQFHWISHCRGIWDGFHSFERKSVMQYWQGLKGPTDTTDPRMDRQVRVLTLEQEFSLCSMKLKMSLQLFDLAFRFDKSHGSRVLTTWMSSWQTNLGGWSTGLTGGLYIETYLICLDPKCRVILDCTEVFSETPSSLEAVAVCWSNYKPPYNSVSCGNHNKWLHFICLRQLWGQS